MNNHEQWMKRAIELSIESVAEGGGPFGAVIVDKATGKIIGEGKNRVAINYDPTAHGEIEAIRNAGTNTKRLEFNNCVLYTSAEPCVGCLTEILFNAEIKEIYYGNSVEDATKAGFADQPNWDALESSAMDVCKKAGASISQIMQKEAQEGFVAWDKKTDKTEYYKA